MNNIYQMSSDFEKLYDMLHHNAEFQVVGYRKNDSRIFKIYFSFPHCVDTVFIEGSNEDHIIISTNEENIWDLTKEDFVKSIKEFIDCYIIPNAEMK